MVQVCLGAMAAPVLTERGLRAGMILLATVTVFFFYPGSLKSSWLLYAWMLG